MDFDSRENAYTALVLDNDGTMGLEDVINHTQYKNNGVHHYIRIRRSNGTIGLYETNSIYKWVIISNGKDPITREDLWYQKSRIRDKKKWFDLFIKMKTSDITIEFKQRVLMDYLNNPTDIIIREKARSFIDIATFEHMGLIHKNLSFSQTNEFFRQPNRSGWMLRMSSKHKSAPVNSHIAVFASSGIQQRFQETDGLGYIRLSGSVIGDPMSIKQYTHTCLIDILEFMCSKRSLLVKDIIYV